MADILPTGYFAVRSALRHPNLEAAKKTGTLSVAVVGLGPVGLVRLCPHRRFITTDEILKVRFSEPSRQCIGGVMGYFFSSVHDPSHRPE